MRRSPSPASSASARVVEAALAQLEARRRGGQRSQRLSGRRRRHGRQHGAHAARGAGRARPARVRPQDRSIDDIGRDEIVDSVARAALLGARGNSGVILSQLIRGAAEELVSPPRRARRPGADRRRHGARRRPRVRLGPRAGRGHDPHRRARDGRPRRVRARAHGRAAALAPAVDRRAAGRAAGRGARARARRRPGHPSSAAPSCCRCCARPAWSTPAATALTVMFAGVDRRAARRRAARRSSTTRRRASRTRSTSPRPTATARTSPSPARTSTPTAGSRALEALGDSVLVVGDRTTLKVHVHTDEPERATAAVRRGRRGLAPRRRRHARAGRRADRAPRRQAPQRRDAALLARRAPGDGHAASCSRASARRARRRPDAEPVDLRAARRHPRRRPPRRSSCSRTPERDHGRRARGRAVREDRPRRAVAFDAGRPRRRARARPGRGADRERRGDDARRWSTSAPAASRARRATTRRGPLPPRRRRRLRRRAARGLGRARGTLEAVLGELGRRGRAA